MIFINDFKVKNAYHSLKVRCHLGVGKFTMSGLVSNDNDLVRTITVYIRYCRVVDLLEVYRCLLWGARQGLGAEVVWYMMAHGIK